MDKTKARTGQLRISRYRSNQEPYRGINILIQDDESRAMVLEAEITIEDLGNVITGSEVECHWLARPVPISKNLTEPC